MALLIVQLLKCLLRLLILEPLLWIYHTTCRLLRCCIGRKRAEAYQLSLSQESTYYLHGDLVVHERQYLQLCAVHTINNLLQLTTHKDYALLPWCCGSIRWRTTNINNTAAADHPKQQQFSLEPVTQTEIDSIACDLTRAEEALMQRKEHRSWYQRLHCCSVSSSNHRTPYYGNYSFETLEMALQKRNVSLEWFQVSNLMTDMLVSSSSSSSSNSGSISPSNALLDVVAGRKNNKNTESIVVGFVINSIECDNPCGELPILRTCCEEAERHWYAISRVRRRANTKDFLSYGSSSTAALDNEAPEEDRWKIVNSDRLGEAPVLREDELRDHLQQLATQDATIFRAILTVHKR